VLAIDARTRLARVLLLEGSNGAMHTQPGVVFEAALDLVDAAAVGDLVLVHQGFVIGPAEAA
jgi:hydrogenase maturation factor